MAAPASGYDYVELLRSPTTPLELRASAEAMRKAHVSDMHTTINAAYNTYIEHEKAYRAAVSQANSTDDPAAKRAAIQLAAAETIKVMEAERALQSARYPHRYNTTETIPQKYVVRGGDPDKGVTVTRLMCIPSYVHERVVESGSGGAAGGSE
jgi:hypothetical protein